MELLIHFRKNISFLKKEVFSPNRLFRTFCTNQNRMADSCSTIIDTSYGAQKYLEKKKWHEKIRALPTVEEKLIEINMPSYYGWKSLSLSEGVIPYNSLSFFQSITRTHFIQTDDIYNKSVTQEFDKYCSQLVDEFQPFVIDLLLFSHHNRRSSTEESELGYSIVRQLNMLIMANLSKDAPHLVETQVDYDPRVEAFWIAGGMEPTDRTMKSRKNIKHVTNIPEDRNIQYVGYPVLQVRHPEPLPPIVATDASDNLTVPFFVFDPRVHGLQLNRRHGTSIPGFWPGDTHEFSLMSYHICNHIKNRPHAYGSAEHAEALHCQAILASYSWLLTLACYQGFSSFCDVTYPLVTQTVITDGQIWSFYTYQLNTTLLHSINYKDNPRCNICWGTHSLKLYEKIEDGNIVGFNKNVLKILLKLYLNKPHKRDVEMKPYLSKHLHVANIADEEKRIWLAGRFKHLYSLRPRHRPLPEVYDWEKIYKIDHKTRPMDARRRPFELGVNPFKRRLDQHTASYIPKALRVNKKKKWAKTYYP